MVAVQERHYAIVEALLAADANVNLANEQGATALLIAAQDNRLVIASLLLLHRADVTATVAGHTAIALAQAGGHTAMVDLLRTFGAR